jgi:hypothetical protein
VSNFTILQVSNFTILQVSNFTILQVSKFSILQASLNHRANACSCYFNVRQQQGPLKFNAKWVAISGRKRKRLQQTPVRPDLLWKTIMYTCSPTLNLSNEPKFSAKWRKFAQFGKPGNAYSSSCFTGARTLCRPPQCRPAECRLYNISPNVTRPNVAQPNVAFLVRLG